MSDQALNISFVEEVEKHEVLYNYTLPGYSRKDVTEKAWHEVAAKVNMTAAECKEKWRNLRTVFARNMKPPKSGSKKAYYLTNAMQFCIPFIKSLAPPPTGNLPPIPRGESSNELLDDGQPLNINDGSLEDSSDMFEPSHQVLTPPRPPFQPKLMRKPGEDADKCVAEYFKAKKARLEAASTTAPSASERKAEKKVEALKMFFLSLIPEVENFDDNQIKLLKRKILNVIDEISPLHSPIM